MTALLELITSAMQASKAEDIQAFHVAPLTTIADYMIIASGRTARQAKAIAERISEAAKQQGYPPPRIEGAEQAEWILLDFGDVIVHIMQPPTRAYYRLEALWAKAVHVNNHT